MNTLRFWGGGYYEDDALFDLCDERGICIWLDFKFGCSTYPAFDEAFLKNCTEEARDNIARLRHHPSIALWCGNNEIMFFRGGKQWTADKMSEGDYYKLFRDTLGEEVRRLAPQSDYVTGSPDCGDVHFWEVWHGGKPFEVYRNIHGFVSEFGFQSFPEPKTVRSLHHGGRPAVGLFAGHEVPRTLQPHVHRRQGGRPHRHRQDHDPGEEVLSRAEGFREHFVAQPDYPGLRHQVRRRRAGAAKRRKSMGCVYWQYNDCWPCSSWSSVDYFGRWKALHYMARRFYAPLLVSGAEDAKGRKVDLYVTSDRREDCQGSLRWTVTDVSGGKIDAGSIDVDIAAGKSRLVRSLDLRDAVQKHGPNNLLVWLKLDVAGQTVSENLVTLAYPRELNLLDPALSAEIAEKGPRSSPSRCMPRIPPCGRGWNSTASMRGSRTTSYMSARPAHDHHRSPGGAHDERGRPTGVEDPQPIRHLPVGWDWPWAKSVFSAVYRSGV